MPRSGPGRRSTPRRPPLTRPRSRWPRACGRAGGSSRRSVAGRPGSIVDPAGAERGRLAAPGLGPSGFPAARHRLGHGRRRRGTGRGRRAHRPSSCSPAASSPRWSPSGSTAVTSAAREAPHGVILAKPLPLAIPVDSSEAMQALGARLAHLLRPGDLVIASGDLGAGKTTLTQGIGRGLGSAGPIISPTFVLSRVHPSATGRPTLVHVDAYRLSTPPSSTTSTWRPPWPSRSPWWSGGRASPKVWPRTGWRSTSGPAPGGVGPDRRPARGGPRWDGRRPDRATGRDHG